MDFFERLGDTITFTGKQVVQKTQETADIARLNGRILSEKDKIRASFIAIGEKYYKEHENEPNEKFIEYFKTVKESNENIVLLRKKIGRVKGVDTCVFCGSEIISNSIYCSICGKKRENSNHGAAKEPTEANCQNKEEDTDIFDD